MEGIIRLLCHFLAFQSHPFGTQSKEASDTIIRHWELGFPSCSSTVCAPSQDSRESSEQGGARLGFSLGLWLTQRMLLSSEDSSDLASPIGGQNMTHACA